MRAVSPSPQRADHFDVLAKLEILHGRRLLRLCNGLGCTAKVSQDDNRDCGRDEPDHCGRDGRDRDSESSLHRKNPPKSDLGWR